MNKVFLSGVIDAVNIRQTSSGEMANIRVKTSSTFKDKTFDDWHTVVAFDSGSISAVKNAVKGDAVTLSGKLRTRSYEKDGEKKYVTEVVVSAVDDLIVHVGSGSVTPAARPAAPAPVPAVEELDDDPLPF